PLKVGFLKSLGQVEQIAAIISALGGIAIFLAGVGLLGLVTYAVSQWTKEIAIRLAVGAGRVEILSVVLRRFAWPVVTGLALGVGMAAAASQVLRRGLYGLSGLDPISYASAIALLVAILAAAALLPIRRAFRIDVARILHAEWSGKSVVRFISTGQSSSATQEAKENATDAKDAEFSPRYPWRTFASVALFAFSFVLPERMLTSSTRATSYRLRANGCQSPWSPDRRDARRASRGSRLP